MNKFIRGFAIGVSVLACGVTTTLTATAAPSTTDEQRTDVRSSSVLPADVQAAVRRDLGLSATQAERLFAQQAKATELNTTLPARLGADFAGSWFDARSGKLVVAISNAGRTADVTAAGAEARVVEHSKATLDGIKAELDTLAGVRKNRADAGKAVAGANRAAVAGLVGWYVDAESNSVVITALKGQTAAAKAFAKHGDAVRVKETDAAPRATEFMDGGDPIDTPLGGCSAGFNLRGADGTGYLLTAGHCANQGHQIHSRGAFFGTVLESYFPTWDDALIRAENPGFWQQGPWVDNSPPNGPVHVVRGWADSPAGTAVCKSGRTTLVTCGFIRAKGETVTLSDGSVVQNLSRNSSCSEPGDSGGSNFSGWADITAEGVSSLAQLRWDGSRWRCLGAFGEESISWYFPIGDSLSWYGPRYNLGVWL